MALIYLSNGRINHTVFERVCDGHAAQEPPQDRPTPKGAQGYVFLFPGNSSHHGKGTRLFSRKTGGGLATVAAELGSYHYATLSLPTTTMEKWTAENQTSSEARVVAGAIADVYRAVGAGFNLVLPVRGHVDDTYFSDRVLSNDPFNTTWELRHVGEVDIAHETQKELQQEPSFWGGIQAVANKELADHYAENLDKLHAFASKPLDEQIDHAIENIKDPRFEAFLDGYSKRLRNDPWAQVKNAEPYKITSQEELMRLYRVEYALLEHQLNKKITELSNKFELNCYDKVNDAARTLMRELKTASTEFFAEKLTAESLGKFNSACSTAIETADVEFSKHRDSWGRFPGFVRGSLGLVSAATVIPALITAATSKRGFFKTFFGGTDLHDKLASFKNRLSNQILVDKANKKIVHPAGDEPEDPTGRRSSPSK